MSRDFVSRAPSPGCTRPIVYSNWAIPSHLERLLLATIWNHLERLSDGHHFDFAAVVIYVMRWDLVARWTGYHGEEAAQRFDALVAAGMAGIDLDQIAA